MKKFFLLISAVLLSLGMQATVLVHDLELSEFSTYSSSASWESPVVTTTGDWTGIKSGSFDATGYKEVVLELADGYATSNIFFEVEYVDGTPTSQNASNAAGNSEVRITLNGTNVKQLNIKLKSAGSAEIGRVYFYGVTGKKGITNLFSGEHVAATDWSSSWANRLAIDKAAFANAHEGDTIAFTYSSDASASCYTHITSTVYFKTYPNGNMGITSSQSTPKEMKFVLRSEDVTGIQAHGMYFEGINYTISKVDLITYSQQMMAEVLLSSGELRLNWGEQWKHTTDLPTFEAGDELRVNIYDIWDSSNKQLYFYYGWGDGQNFGLDVSIDNTTPKTYKIALTQDQADKINAAGQLFISGTGIELNRFSYAKPRSIYNTLWHGEQVIDWTGIQLPESSFSSLTVGDILCANVAAKDGEGSPQLWMVANGTDFTPQAHYCFNSRHTVPMTVSYVVDEAMLALIQSNGLRIKGAKCTVTDIYVQSATATTASYTLSVSAAGMATLVLPFNVPTLPAGVEVYTITNSGSDVIYADEVTSIEADKPVLVVAPEGEYTFTSEPGANWDISGKSWWTRFTNGHMVGTYRPTHNVAQIDDDNFNYILQDGADGVAFYQVRDNTCTLSPYRAYLSCGYNANAGGSPAPMRMIKRPKTPTDVASTEQSTIGVQKVLRDGQLYIVRDNKMYTIQGQLAK